MPHQKTRNGQKRRVGVSCLPCAVMVMCVFMWSTLTFTGPPLPRVVRQSMVIRGAKKKDATKAAKDNRANQRNPNHPEYKGRKNGKKKSNPGAASMNHKTSVETNNRANQKNPNNDEYKKSRWHPPIPPNQKQKVAQKLKQREQQEAAFGGKNKRNPKGRLDTDAFHQFEKALLVRWFQVLSSEKLVRDWRVLPPRTRIGTITLRQKNRWRESSVTGFCSL